MTWLSIVVLSLVTTVIAEIVYQIVQRSLWYLHKGNGLLSHLVIYRGPVPSTFLLLKAAWCSPSVVAVEQLSNLQTKMTKLQQCNTAVLQTFSMFPGLHLSHSFVTNSFLHSSHCMTAVPGEVFIEQKNIFKILFLLHDSTNLYRKYGHISQGRALSAFLSFQALWRSSCWCRNPLTSNYHWAGLGEDTPDITIWSF